MFSVKMTTEEMSKKVSDRLFERASQDAEALDKLRQSNPGATPTTEPPVLSGGQAACLNPSIFYKKMTTEDMERAISTSIFERVAHESESFSKNSLKKNNLSPK